MNIIKFPLKPSQIKFLGNDQTLYTCDLRSIGESMDYDIPAMWKYENLIPWILNDKYATVNDADLIQYVNKNRLINIDKGLNSKISIYKKLFDLDLPPDISTLWVAAPHPDADVLAKKRNYKINYSYTDFIAKNDKLGQKKLLEGTTPPWHQIKNSKDLKDLLAKQGHGYLKRKHGSGGFTIFNSQTEGSNPKFIELFAESPNDWFFEEYVKGRSCSIQCLKYKDDDSVTVFGYSEQIIVEEKYFSGSKIKPLETLSDKVFGQLSDAIKKLHPLLSSYEGFFGLDFIVTTDENIFVLESNIRLTAATIPTLLTNQAGGGESLYREDVGGSQNEATVALTRDHINRSCDILEFISKTEPLGKSISFASINCKKLEKSLKDIQFHELESLVNENVGVSTKMILENFWPFGWTVCFVLEESHCVISSWFLEKRILVDVFSCNIHIDADRIIKNLGSFFGSNEVLNIKIENR